MESISPDMASAVTTNAILGLLRICLDPDYGLEQPLNCSALHGISQIEPGTLLTLCTPNAEYQ